MGDVEIVGYFVSELVPVFQQDLEKKSQNGLAEIIDTVVKPVLDDMFMRDPHNSSMGLSCGA